jgi:hypothetical protein
MALTLSMRRLWKFYRETMVESGATKSEIALACDAFYWDGRSVLAVLDHLRKAGEMDELHQTIGRFGRQVTAITRSGPRLN